MNDSEYSRIRVPGLDAIRAVLAIWVAMNHVAPPPLAEGADKSTIGGWVLKSALGLSINGQAAVIGFFVISGFCIHYPYRARPLVDVLPFYIRRGVRVGGPFLVVIIATQFLPSPWRELEEGIFWSVYAELVYYTLYPAAAWMARRIGWGWLTIITFVFSPAVLVLPHPGGNYHAVGDAFAWILGLPCWLLGCRLAGRFSLSSVCDSNRIVWLWRVSIWAVSVFCFYLRFHTPVKHYHTLNLYAILVYLWLGRELKFFSSNTPPKWLERIGTWSYSLYLVHFFGAFFVSLLPVNSLGYFVSWCVVCLAVATVARLFAFLVEAPFHYLAKYLAESVSGPRKLLASRISFDPPEAA